jgi:hypothetical protein
MTISQARAYWDKFAALVVPLDFANHFIEFPKIYFVLHMVRLRLMDFIGTDGNLSAKVA